MEFNDSEVIEKIKALAIASVGVVMPNGGNVPFALCPKEYTLQNLAPFLFNEHNERPERIKQTVTVLDPPSFVEYYKRFADPESRIFAYEPERKVTAVLDYHESATGNDSEGTATPRWGQHKVVLNLRQSEEWGTWTGSNNKQMTQDQFAEFLEQNSIDIAEPDPAHMREVASDMKATVDVDFGSAGNRANGQVRFKYTETMKASVGSGSLAIPEQFVVGLPVFVGGPRITIQALLRFRIKEQKLVLWYTLIRAEECLRKAFLAAREEISDALDATIINGQVG